MDECGPGDTLPDSGAPLGRDRQQYVSLHSHTEHSFLDGIPKISDFVGRIVELGQDAACVTDHGECSGHLRLQRECDKAGIKPIFGSELYFCDDRFVKPKEGRKGTHYEHITVWALNNQGLSNLWALNSEAHISGQWYGDPRFDWDLLQKYHEGLAISGGCVGGAVTAFFNEGNENFSGRKYDPDRGVARLSQFLEIMGDRFFLELHTYRDENQHKVNDAMVALASDFSVPLIAVSDSHYLRPEDWLDHEQMTALQMGKAWDDPTRYQYGPDQLRVFAEPEVRQRLDYLGDSVVTEAIANTRLIADWSDARIEQRELKPVFFDSRDTDRMKFRELCAQGFDDRVRRVAPPDLIGLYQERMDYELDVISSKGYAGYFLRMEDAVRRMHEDGVLTQARGSAVGCLVSFALGISEVDPIRAGLFFERFMDPGRDSMPDIDIDISQDKRPHVKRKFGDVWGDTNVAVIGSFTILRPLALLKDLCRLLKIPRADEIAIQRMLNKVPDIKVAHIDTPWSAIQKSLGEQLAPYAAEHPRLFELMDKFCEHIRNPAVHASGIIISKESLIGKLPLRLAIDKKTKEPEIRTQFDYKDVEWLGYPKDDFLGLRNLSTLDVCWQLVKERQPERCPEWYDEWVFDFDRYLDDSAVYQSSWGGKNIGIFQFESPDFRRVVKRFKPANLEDVAAMISVWRPGITRAVDPDTGVNLYELYMQKREGTREVTYKHPLLEPILSPTAGTFLYQEQVMRAFQDLAGFTLSEADQIRRMLGKKEVEKLRQMRDQWLAGCATNDIDAHTANQIYDEIANFATYAFNKSHAFSYAVTVVKCLYMKHYFPAEFMTALCLTNEDDVPVYARECSRMGIPMRGVDINESSFEFNLSPTGNLHFGLSKVKFLANGANAVVEHRPFTSVLDFVQRVPKKSVNKKQATSLIAAGAMDSLVTADDRARFGRWSDSKIALYQYYNARNDKEHLELCDGCRFEPDVTCCLDASAFLQLCADINIEDRAALEREYLGVALSIDPLEGLLDLIESETTYVSEQDMDAREVVRIGGVITRVQVIVTKSGKTPGAEMCKMVIEIPRPKDEENEQPEITVFPEAYAVFKKDIELNVPVLADVSRLRGGGICLAHNPKSKRVGLFRLDGLDNR